MSAEIFTQRNHAGNRARCPECSEDKKDYSVQIEPEHAYCHRCSKRWWFGEKSDYEPDTYTLTNTKEIKSSGAVEESNFDACREAYRKNFDFIVQTMGLPWPSKALDPILGIGARNNKEEIQLVFKINSDHVKYHKGKQFGSASCKIYPETVLDTTPKDSTLIVCEGEKDAITAYSHGAPAITFTSGAGALPQDISKLQDFTQLVICYDNDSKGKEGAAKIAKQLFKQNKKRKIRIIEWQNKPETYDVTDYFADGHTLHDFHGLIEAAPVFGSDPRDFGGLPEYDPDTFMEERNQEVVEICEEILLENGTSGISGSSNVGKSILALQFAVAVAMGVPFLTFRVPRPRRVLFVQFEMLDTMIAHRLKPLKDMMLRQYPTAEKDYKKNLRITSVANRKIFTDAYDTIEGNLMAADPPFDVLVIDNLYTSTSADIAKNDQLTKLMSRLDQLKEEYGVALMLISHHKKQEEKRPLDHGMVFGGSYYVNFLDNLIQVANTGRHKFLKVFKITKVRYHNQFHDVPLGILLHADEESLHFEYKKPLPKNEMYWYQEPEESEEEKILNALDTQGDNFTYKDMATVLADELNITSSRSVYKWLDKLETMGLITKVEHGHFAKLPNELENFLN